MIDAQAFPDDLFIIIATMNEFSAALVAYSRFFRRRIGQVMGGPAIFAYHAFGQTLDNLLIREIQIDDNWLGFSIQTVLEKFCFEE